MAIFADGNALLMSEWQKDNSNSDNHSVQLCWAEKHLIDAGSPSISQEQESDATLGAGSPKIGRWRL